MAPMRCAVLATDTGHLVTVDGEVDIASAPQLAETLAQFANGSVTVDIAGVVFLDSSGLHALLAAHKHTERRGATLTIHGARPAVRRLFEVAGVADVLHVAEDQTVASI
jgi:anti-sigma B factor antagonist